VFKIINAHLLQVYLHHIHISVFESAVWPWEFSTSYRKLRWYDFEVGF